MKKIFLSLSLSMISANALASNIILNNQTDYPKKEGLNKIAVQWAVSATEVQTFNMSILKGSKLKANSLMMLSQRGIIKLSPPSNAQYFRVIVWSSNQQKPESLTNWVGISPNKTYLVQQNQLVPRVLFNGAGC